MVTQPDKEAAFDRMIRANRPQAPEALHGEMDRILARAQRPRRRWIPLGLGLAAAMAALALLPRAFQPPAPVSDAELESFLFEARSEMMEPVQAENDPLDYYASL